jgi:hypothetical protein
VIHLIFLMSFARVSKCPSFGINLSISIYGSVLDNSGWMLVFKRSHEYNRISDQLSDVIIVNIVL